MHHKPTAGREPRAIGGWLLVLCLGLLFWEPLNLGLAGANALAAISVRGLPVAVMLLVRVAVAALGIGAGLSLLARRGPAVALAKASLVISAATHMFVALTPYFPSQRRPGDLPIDVAATVVVYGAWFAYLHRSKRVRDTYA